MTKEDWNDIEARLSDQYDMVTLDVDGYRIDIQVEREKGLKFYYAVYVNKKITGEWIFDDNDEALEIRRRFYQVHRKSLLTAEERKSLSRKSKRVREAIVAKSWYYWYSPYWNSFRNLKNHLIKNNSDIEIVELPLLENV